MSDFIVRFEGVDLSKEHTHKLQSAIQRTVLTELSASSLAGYTPQSDGPEPKAVASLFPIGWRGIIIVLQDTLREKPQLLDQQLTVHAQ